IDHYLSAQRLSKPLVSKAQIFCELYKQNSDLREIQAAFEHVQQLVLLLNKMRNQQSEEEEQLFLSEETVTFYDLAIEIAWMLYDKTKKEDVLAEMFLFVEKGKAMVLLSSLQKNSAKLESNIPTTILKEAKSLEVNISELKKQLKVASDKNLHLGLQKELFQATLQSETLTTQLERDYPEYYQLKYKTPTIGIQELQKILGERKAENPVKPAILLLSYYVAEKYIYIFEVTPNAYDVHRLEKPDDLEHKILDFQDAINLIDVEDYVEVSTDLYDLLLAPILEKDGLSRLIPQKMIVLRHDLLDYLPFEALLTTDSIDEMDSLSFANLPYLIHYYEISYHYSSALLLNKIRQSEKTTTRQNSFLGFAPVSFNDSDMEEVELELESQNGASKVLRSNRAGETALQNLPNTETEV
ncbi:MAG: CHAT domain-containing protein, partial [Chitinophagales bacterium]